MQTCEDPTLYRSLHVVPESLHSCIWPTEGYCICGEIAGNLSILKLCANFKKFHVQTIKLKWSFHHHNSKKSNTQQNNLKQLMIIQISKLWAWILLLISISASILLSSIVFLITELEPIDEMESIKKDKIQLNWSIDNMMFQIDLEGVSSSNLQILRQSHICVEVLNQKN